MNEEIDNVDSTSPTYSLSWLDERRRGRGGRYTLDEARDRGCPDDVILAAVKEAALKKVKTLHAEALRRKMGFPTPEERDTYERQVRAAEAFIANKHTPAQGQMLNLLKRDEETATALARRIVAKAGAGDLLIAVAGGTKRKADAAIEAADAVEAVTELLAKTKPAIAEAEATYDQMLAEALANETGGA